MRFFMRPRAVQFRHTLRRVLQRLTSPFFGHSLEVLFQYLAVVLKPDDLGMSAQRRRMGSY